MTDASSTRTTLSVADTDYTIYSLKRLAAQGHGDLARLPKSLKVLLENLLRRQDGSTAGGNDIGALIDWTKTRSSTREIAFGPARVLMQDFTGVPALVDLAAMRDALEDLGKDPQKINPRLAVDLVIDHSVMVDHFGSADSFRKNVALEYERNRERYQFLKWGQRSFSHFRVVPPGTGICHQINLEYLARTVFTATVDGHTLAYPDTLVGTDSHTTMVNALGVLGWGVGGIEAEAAMLGQPISLLIPEVVGVKLTGTLGEGVTATDLVLRVVELLRQMGVVGTFVEYFGSGMAALPLADRATLANMAPEYGATCGFFPVDEETLTYLRMTGRSNQQVALVEQYCKEQGLWHDPDSQDPLFSSILELDMSTVVPSLAGPKRPQDRVALYEVPRAFEQLLSSGDAPASPPRIGGAATGVERAVQNGDVVIAAITSCTNTSNPAVMIAAGLVAKKAVEKGLATRPWVKTSLAPGSRVVSEYLKKSGLEEPLDTLGFNLAGYGCTTCIGNSGPLPPQIAAQVDDHKLVVCAVLSGNRNFEGRVHAQVQANWLASPPLVVAYALAGTVLFDWQKTPLGSDSNGANVYLKDIWPSSAEIKAQLHHVAGPLFDKEYASVFEGDEAWQTLQIPQGTTYAWHSASTYIRKPPFFGEQPEQQDIRAARILALLGDSVTTDHISPAGAIPPNSPAGAYLQQQGLSPAEFNSYGSHRGNHEVMLRGTFANLRIRNELVPGIEGGATLVLPGAELMSIYDAAMVYAQNKVALVVIAGREYGTGSSRDWAAKGTRLLGVRAVMAESFERIHRSNLLGMGVLPLQFAKGVGRKSLGLDGTERVDIGGSGQGLTRGAVLNATFTKMDGSVSAAEVVCRIDTAKELQYYRAGGILNHVLAGMD